MTEKPNDSLLPITRKNNELFQLDSRNLTPSQYQQLERVVSSYLRQNELPKSFSNFQGVLPVIKNCVEKGLREKKRTTVIDPSDQLDKAFKIGFSERNETIELGKNLLENFVSEELESKISEDTVSIFALSSTSVSDSMKELDYKNKYRNLVFNPYLISTKSIIDEVKVKMPIFNKLLDLSRNMIEKVIPESKEIKLTPIQEAGLVRNMLFNWVSIKSSIPLPELEDIVQNSQEFQKVVKEEKEEVIKEIQDLIEDNSIESKKYISQLLDQISKRLEKTNVTGISIDSDESADNLYKEMKSTFFIEHPFKYRAKLSEDPKEVGNSIWDDERSITVDINGKIYRIPSSKTLKNVASRNRADDTKRAVQLEAAADVVESLLEEKQRQSESSTISNLSNKAEEQYKKYQNFPDILRSNAIDQSNIYSKTEMADFIASQLESIKDEKSIHTVVRAFLEEKRQLALALMIKYQEGQSVEGEDIEKFDQIYWASSYLTKRIRHYFKDRIKDRIYTFERVHSLKEIGDAILSPTNPNYKKQYFDAALNTTVVDLLVLRDQWWRKEFFGNDLTPDVDKAKLIWRAYLTLEDISVTNRLYDRAKIAIDFNRRLKDENETEQEAAMRLAKERHPRLIYGYQDDLQKEIRKFEHFLELERDGQLTTLKDFPSKIVNGIRRNRNNVIDKAISAWMLSEPVSKPIIDKPASLFSEEIQKKRKKFASGDKFDYSPEAFHERLKKPGFPFEICINVLAHLTEDDMWPKEEITIDELAHNARILPSSPPFVVTKEDYEKITKDKKQNFQPVTESFYQNLKQYGYNGEYSEIRQLFIKDSNLYHHVKSIGTVFSYFFQLKPDLYQWLDQVEEKVLEQSKIKYTLLNTPPDKIYSSLKHDANETATRLDALQKRDAKRLQEMTDVLRNYGVILPESYF